MKYEQCNQTVIFKSSLQIFSDKINRCVLSSSRCNFRCTKNFCVPQGTGTYE